MKKIFALILCAFLLCTTSIVAFAEEGENATEVTENTTVEETATESENSPSEPTIPDKIAGFFSEHFEGTSFVSLAVTIIGYVFYEKKKHRRLDGSIGTLNNNAITVATNSANAIANCMEVVNEYREEFASFMEEIRKNAEDKLSLEEMLRTVDKTLQTSKMASMELANEVAELLVLANIPPSKKEELYARHRAAVDALATAENTEVVTNDGKEA